MFAVRCVGRAVRQTSHLSAGCAVTAGDLSTGRRRWSSSTAGSQAQRSRWALSVAAGLLAGGALTLLSDESKPRRWAGATAFAAGDEAAPSQVEKWRQRVKSNYAERIRRWSSPEKLFEVFASTTKDSGEMFMTVSDFRDSLLPADFDDETQTRTVREVPAIFKMMDLDGDGLISYQEYVLFTAFLSIPLHHYELAFKMFDSDGNGTLSQQEFVRCMQSLLKSSPYGATTREAPFGLDPRAGVKHEHGAEQSLSGLLAHFFGRQGERELPLADFKDFMEQFLMAVLRLEFDRFDADGSGSISARDFGMAIVGYARPKELSRLRDRLQQLRQEPRRVSWHDFINYQFAMQQIQEIVQALELYTAAGAPFSRQEFAHAVFAVTGRCLSDLQMDVIFFLFDEDDSGTFNLEEVANIFQSRQSRNLSTSRDLGVWSRLACCRDCFRSSS